jgi:hypothetical protein
MTLEDRTKLRKLLEKELSCGALRIASPDEVNFLSPVHVVQTGASSKPRLIHDLRAVNAFLCKQSTQFERVRDALALGVRYATKIDLMNAFKHVQVAKQDRAYLAFTVDNVIFQWTTLPFGLSWSPLLFQRALRPCIEQLRRIGIRLVVYMDDILIGADTPEELDASVVKTLEVLRSAGWAVAKDKVYPWAHEQLRFLGLLVDLKQNKLRVPKSKASKLQDLCEHALQRDRIALPILQKIVGLLAFFLCAAPFVALSWRGLLGAMVEAEKLPGRHVWMRGRLRQEIDYWATSAQTLPNAPGM